MRALTLLSVKRTLDLFAGNHGQKVPLDDDGSAALSTFQASTVLDVCDDNDDLTCMR